MLPRPCGIPFSQISRATWLVGILLLLSPLDLLAQQNRNHVIIRKSFSPAHREQLATKLRRITGFPDLSFDNDGKLLQGSKAPVGGSASARELIASATSGRNVVVIEDASNRSDVAFCRVIPGRWKKNSAGSPPGFVIQIDFADFNQVMGDGPALEAFNVGWGLLHELDHIVNESSDANALGGTGACEAHINQMRRECNLPQRADYFYTLLPLSKDTGFMTKLVRLAFDQEHSDANKKKRYWVLWDANVVGGLDAQKQIAALR